MSGEIFKDLTDFEWAVLKATLDIPFGETRSYKWVAERIGRPQAVRAVGQALRKNPVPADDPLPPGDQVQRGTGRVRRQTRPPESAPAGAGKGYCRPYIGSGGGKRAAPQKGRRLRSGIKERLIVFRTRIRMYNIIFKNEKKSVSWIL